MKKALLLGIVAMAATVSFGAEKQDTKVKAKSTIVNNTRLQVSPVNIDLSQRAQKNVMKSAKTGLYYAKPAGALYSNFSKDNMGYYSTRIVVTPFTKFTFANKSDEPLKSLWHLNMYQVDQNGNVIERHNDVTEYKNEDGSFSNVLDAGYYMAAPTILNAAQTDSFTIGKETNSYWSGQAGTPNDVRDFTKVATDSISPLGYMDDHVYGGYAYGSLSTGWLIGNGQLNHPSNGVGTCFAMIQSYAKPMSPLYVEDIYVSVYSSTDTPIAEGKSLTMYICDTEKGDTLYTLTAKSSDVFGLEGPFNSDYTQTGVAYASKVLFSMTEKDVFGNEVKVPFVLNCAFDVIIDGFDKEGIDMGITGNDILPEDADEVEDAGFLVYYPEIETTYIHSYEGLGVNFTFTGVMDYAEVANSVSTQDGNSITDFNIIRVSNDGQSCSVDGQNAELAPGALVVTGMDWYDLDGNEYYYFDFGEDVDWIEATTATPGVYGDGTYGVTFTASPLGTEKGRHAVGYLKGRGVTSEVPVIVVQGEVNIEEVGIDNIKTENNSNSPVYNLMGQKVGASAKGLLIRDGKKFINK